MSYSNLLAYFDMNYPRITMATERKLFPCRKFATVATLKYEYPDCYLAHFSFCSSWFQKYNRTEIYAQIIIEDIKKRHPTKVMEAYLLCGEDS